VALCCRRNLLIFQAPCSIREWFAEWMTRGAVENPCRAVSYGYPQDETTK
jgi:hypothetical protein